MSAKIAVVLVFGLVMSMMLGCSPMVYKQTIPVSSNPLGAKIYADGVYVGVTPTTVPLDRNRDHILTLLLDNQQQRDVVISRVYQQERVLIKAVSEGMETGRFFKNSTMGFGRGVSSLSSQEQTGEAYILSPSSVTVMFVPGGKKQNTSRYSEAVAAMEEQQNNRQASTGPSIKTLTKVGAGVAATQIPAVEKSWSSSSSSTSTQTKPGSTTTTTKSSSTRTTIGVRANPVGIIDVLDTLFK